MTVDETNSYLVTGDADGIIKVWDISEYCIASVTENESTPRKLIFIFEVLLQQSVFQQSFSDR